MPPAPKPDPDDSKPLGLLVTVAPMWLIQKVEDDYGPRLRNKGKVIVMDVDHQDIQVVNAEGDDFHVLARVTPKGKGK
jgi:hypothetical protein